MFALTVLAAAAIMLTVLAIALISNYAAKQSGRRDEPRFPTRVEEPAEEQPERPRRAPPPPPA